MDQGGLRVALLGGFRVVVGGTAVPPEPWRRRKPAALVKILSLSPGHRVHREQLLELLWPDLDASAAGANLRKAIHQARSALDGVSQGAAGLIEFGGDVVALAVPDTVVDVDTFRSALTTARRAASADAYRQALDRYEGDLLPEDLYEEWAAGPRRALREDYQAGLHELADLVEVDGDIAGAIEVVRRQVTSDPLREESHASLMRLYSLAGRRADALHQYDHLAELLDTELGVEPGAEVQRLREEIKSRQGDDPELTADLWERVGDLRVLAGDGAGAAKAFERALGADLAADVSSRIERKGAEAWLMQHRPDLAEPHLDAAERHGADEAETGRLMRARAILAWEAGHIDEARGCALRARDIASSSGTPTDLAAAHETVAIVSHFQGEWREGLESELERLALGSADTAELARVFDVHHCIGQFHLYGDGLSGSVEGYARRILDRAEDAGAVRAQAFAWCLLGESLLLQARWEESDGCLERSCALHETLGSRSGALPWQRRAELAACLARHDDVEAHLRKASGIATVSPMASHLWGRIYATSAFDALTRGDADRAVAAVQSAVSAAARYGDCPTCSALMNPVAAEAFAALGDDDNTRSYRDAATRAAGHFSSSALQAMAECAAGSAAVVEGDRAGAASHFDQAQSLYRQAEQPFWAERTARQASDARSLVSGER